jgi:exopolysaccharide biosynthesis polyprenyl glycosylphosphotransferase
MVSKTSNVVPAAVEQRQVSGLSLNLSERRLLLKAMDGIALVIALWCSLALRSDVIRPGVPMDLADVTFITWSITLLLIWLPCASLAECYSLTVASNTAQALIRTGATVAAVMALYLLTPKFTPELPQSRLDLLYLPILTVGFIWLWRLAYIYLIGHPRCEHRALVVGAGQAGQLISSELRELERLTCGKKLLQRRDANEGGCTQRHGVVYSVVGFIDDDPGKQGQVYDGIPVLGDWRHLAALAQSLRVDEIVLAISKAETMRTELVEAILECREQGISLNTMPRLYESLTGRVPVEHAGRNFHVVLPLGRSATHRSYLCMQRLFDLIFGLFGCVLLLLAIPFVALVNRILSPGPLFYSQERVGLGGKSFNIIKFRSMVVDAEKNSGATWAQENDPRITQFGKFLRLTRLDEIPQFINVVRGEMAIVGPRPERPTFVEQLTHEIPFYRARHAVKPGLTGWAQVMYRYGASVEDSLIKLQYDLFYIKYQGIILDTLILFKTILVVVGFKGR